jgi:hypothetical protein
MISNKKIARQQETNASLMIRLQKFIANFTHFMIFLQKSNFIDVNTSSG